MMEYPPSWDVYSNDEFLGYNMGSDADSFGAALLVQMDREVSVSDCFRQCSWVPGMPPIPEGTVTCIDRSRPKKGPQLVFKFFRCSLYLKTFKFAVDANPMPHTYLRYRREFGPDLWFPTGLSKRTLLPSIRSVFAFHWPEDVQILS